MVSSPSGTNFNHTVTTSECGADLSGVKEGQEHNGAEMECDSLICQGTHKPIEDPEANHVCSTILCWPFHQSANHWAVIAGSTTLGALAAPSFLDSSGRGRHVDRAQISASRR